MQLINTAVYSDLAQARTKAIEQTRLAKQSKLEKSIANRKNRLEEKRRARSVVGAMEQVEIDGVKYAVRKGGSKLIRLSGMLIFKTY